MHAVIFIGNTPIDIQDKISVVLRSPVFNENGTPGSFVFNFSVPLSDKIKKELCFSHLPGAMAKVYKKHVSIRAGSFNLEGQASITALGQEKVEISLPVFNGSLKNKLGDLMLTQLPLGAKENLVDYVTIAGLSPLFHFNQWYTTQTMWAVDAPLRFSNIISDAHNTFPDDPPGAGWHYHVPESGTFIFSLRLDYKVLAGRNLRFRARKNNALYVFTKTIAEPTLNEDVADFITFSLELLQGDTIQMRVLMDTSPQQHPSHAGYNHRANITVQTTSILYAYSNYYFNDFVDRGYPYNNFTFLPIYNNNYFANAGQSKFEVDQESLDFVNKKFPFVNFYDNGFPMFLSYSQDDEAYYMFNIISPQVFLPHIIKTLFEHTGIHTISNPFVGDGNINQLCVYAGVCINNISAAATSTIPSGFALNDMLPEIKCADFLADVCKTLGIVFLYDHNTESIIFKTLDEIMSDQSAIAFSSGIISKPHIAVNPFNAFKLEYENLEDPFIDEFYNDLSHVNFKGTVPALINLPWFNADPNDCYYVTQEKAYFYWTKTDIGDFSMHSWQLYSLDFTFRLERKIITSKDDTTFEYMLPSTPIMMRNYPRKDPSWGMPERDLLVPASFSPGKIKGIKSDDKSYHLLFYRGLQKDSNANDYPLGSNAYQNLDGDIDFDNAFEEPFDFNLDMGVNSIYKKRFQKYLSWRVFSHGEYTFYKIMTSDELTGFDFFRWYRILSMDYLVKQLRFEISKDGLSPVEITAVPRDVPVSIPEDTHWLLSSGHWDMSGVWDMGKKWNMET